MRLIKGGLTQRVFGSSGASICASARDENVGTSWNQ
jgi:hypothetical protein